MRRKTPGPSAPAGGELVSGRVHALDVRGLEAPEPEAAILARAQELGPADVLEVTHAGVPLALYPRLEEAGFEHALKALDGGLFLLMIARKA